MKKLITLISFCLLAAGLLALAPTAIIAQTITIITSSSPPLPEGGTTSGGGTYPVGTQVVLTATPNACWMFTNWDDGSGGFHSNPYTITVSSEITNYTAIFVPKQCQINAVPSPDGSGTVSGGGRYVCGSNIELTATPDSCWAFTNWNDGSTNNPHVVMAAGDATYTANFVPITAGVITAVAAGGGTASGSGTYLCGSNIVLMAAPDSCWAFTNWSDGSTNNPHVVVAAGDATYTANFVPISYQINTAFSPMGSGTISGGGSYLCGSNVVLTATPDPCWTFTSWSDGSTDNPHTVTASGDATYTGNFVKRQFTITTKVAPPNGGHAMGNITTDCGATVTVTAVPNPGYKFFNWTKLQWVFGSSPPQWTAQVLSTSAQYSFMAGGSEELTANFVYTNHPCTYTISPATSSFLQPGGTGTVKVYTSSGCAWTYENVPGHIHIIGVTAISLKYTVDALPTIHESGGPQAITKHFLVPFTFQIAGQNFTVLQDQVTIFYTPIATPKHPNP